MLIFIIGALIAGIVTAGLYYFVRWSRHHAPPYIATC